MTARSTFNFAQAQRLDHIDPATVLAPLQTDFIAGAQCIGEKGGAFEVDTCAFDDTRVSIKGVTEQSSLLDWCGATRRGSARSSREYAEQDEHRGEHVGVVIKLCRSEKEADLLRRLAAMTSDRSARSNVGANQFANAIIAKARPLPNGLSACLVFDETQCELEAGSVATVTIISDAHDKPPIHSF